MLVVEILRCGMGEEGGEVAAVGYCKVLDCRSGVNRERR